MKKTELLDIFKSLPEEEKNKVYLEIEKAMKTRELKGMFDVMYLITLEEDIHKEFDTIDYEGMNWQEFIRLKRSLEDIRLLIDRVKTGAYKKAEEGQRR